MLFTSSWFIWWSFQWLDWLDAPNVTVTSATGAGAIIAAVVTLNFGADENVFVNDVPISSDDLRPGGGGILRLYFSFVGATDAKVFNNGKFKGFLNADNSNTIATNGYYRFDIDVEGGDAINLQLGMVVSAVNFVRLHLVNFGAWFWFILTNHNEVDEIFHLIQIILHKIHLLQLRKNQFLQ